MTTPQPKISEALLDFARPLLDLMPADAGPAEVAPVLQIASLVWNSVVLETHGRESPYLEQARAAILSTTSGLERDFMMAVLADMEVRKRRETPPDPRLIGDFEFFADESGAPRLRVNAHALPPETKASR